MRTDTLKDSYNTYWKKALNVDEDLFSCMSLRDFVNLKKAVSNINNIITLETTKQFVHFLVEKDIVSDSQAKKMMGIVEETNANTNGYDIEYPLKRNDTASNYFLDVETKIVAEVKCCIPVNKSSYGAAQEKSIINDIVGLAEGKSKSLLKSELPEYYKFLVLLGANTETEKEKVLESAKKIVQKTLKEHANYKVELFEDSMKLDSSTIYVVIINY